MGADQKVDEPLLLTFLLLEVHVFDHENVLDLSLLQLVEMSINQIENVFFG